MTHEEALDILRDLHKKSLFSERKALEVFFPEFKEHDTQKHLKLEKGKWYLCIKDFQWKPDFTDCHQGEKYYCSREGVVQNFYFQHPEKYFCEYQNNAKDEIVHFIPEGYFAEIRNDAIVIKKEKPIKIKKRHLTGKAADLAKEVTPESLEEAKEKLNAEEKLNQRLNQEIQGWWENSEHMDSLWCTVKDAIELTAGHFFELGLKAKEE